MRTILQGSAFGVIAVLLLFPSVSPSLTGLALACAIPWVLYGLLRKRPWPWTPALWPLGLLLGFVLVGTWLAPFPDVAWPKFTGILLGVLCFAVVAHEAREPRALLAAVVLYLAVGLLFAGSGLLGTALNSKVLSSSLIAYFPQRVRNLPGTDGAVNPNALGATTLFLLPLGLTLLRLRPGDLSQWGARGPAAQPRETVGGDAFAGHRAVPRRTFEVARGALVLLVAVLFGILALSQSRSAWLSMSLVVWILWLDQSKLVRALVIAACLTGVLAVVVVSRPTSADRADSASGGLSIAARAELWSKAIYAIQDFPLTGVGLNGYRRVVRLLYPPVLVAPQVDVSHAHNVFLQTALDTGLPGLVSYLTVLLVALFSCYVAFVRGDRAERLLALGFAGNLVAVHVFGVADAIVLGAKVGIFFWWNLGMIAALHARVASVPSGTAAAVAE